MAFWLLSGLLAFVLKQNFPDYWARATPLPSDDKSELNRLTQALDKMGKDTVGNGTSVWIARFYGKNGAPTDLYVVEGKFTRSEVNPKRTWSHLPARRLLLVSSVDEYLAASTSIGAYIAQGCNLATNVSPSEAAESANHQVLVEPGAFRSEPCQGKYKKEIPNLDSVGEFPVVLTGDPKAKDRCERPEAALTFSCLRNNADVSLRVLFTELIPRSPEITGVIIPALGTGQRYLPKSAFYDLFEKNMHEALVHNHALPRDLYLQVYRADKTPWPDVKTAIKSSVHRLIDEWNGDDHTAADPEWTSLIGVFFGFGLLLILIGLAFPIAAHFQSKNIGVLGSAPFIAMLLGWLVSALTAATILKTFAPTTSWRVEIVLGFFVGLLFGPLMRAAHTFESTA